MSARSFLLAPTLLVLGACSTHSGTPSDSGSNQLEASAEGGASDGGETNASDSRDTSRDGAGGAGKSNGHGTTNSGGTINSPGKPDSASPSPHSNSDADGAGETEVHPTCEWGDTCKSQCVDEEATCGVKSTGVACEFEGFTGATAQVACGERVVVGTACCGGCGCVPVELYFDGENCWQGIPSCDLPEFNNLLFDPHATTTPNPAFVPSGPFYLGEAGAGPEEVTETGDGGNGAGGASDGGDSTGGTNANGGAAGGSGGGADGGATG